MTVTVPSNDPSFALNMQNEIAALKTNTNLPAGFVGFRLNELQIRLVKTLMATQHLDPSTILSTIAYNTVPQQVQYMQGLINSANSTTDTTTTGKKPNKYQQEMVSLLMERGWMTAATILSTMTYLGRPD